MLVRWLSFFVNEPHSRIHGVTQIQRTMVGDEREKFLPHRGRNLLLDEAWVHEIGPRGSSEGALTITPDDTQGRGIFLYELPEASLCVHPVVLIEHVALVGLAALNMEPGEFTFFSLIRKAEFPGRIRAGETLHSTVKAARAPKPFFRFQSTVSTAAGALIATSDVLAYTSIAVTLPAQTDAEPGAGSGALRDEERIARFFPGRDPRFVFVDAPLQVAADGRSGVFAYTYREEHPLARGHFPGQPIMMGVTQLLAIADAAQWLAAELRDAGALDGDASFTACGKLLGADDSLVCSAGALELRAWAGSPILELTAARRVSFRRMVAPPEVLKIEVQINP